MKRETIGNVVEDIGFDKKEAPSLIKKRVTKMGKNCKIIKEICCNLMDTLQELKKKEQHRKFNPFN